MEVRIEKFLIGLSQYDDRIYFNTADFDKKTHLEVENFLVEIAKTVVKENEGLELKGFDALILIYNELLYKNDQGFYVEHSYIAPMNKPNNLANIGLFFYYNDDDKDKTLYFEDELSLQEYMVGKIALLMFKLQK